MSRSAQNLEAALAACLDDLQAGMTPAQCLARYPEYADQLEPLLLTAERLQGQPWPTLSAGGRVRGRERMQAALASRRPAGFAWWSVLRPVLAAVVLLAFAGGVWLAWPGRQTKTTDLPTSAPVVLQATPSPTLTLWPTATLTLTVTATPTGTAGDTNPVPAETNVPEVIEGADGTETALRHSHVANAQHGNIRGPTEHTGANTNRQPCCDRQPKQAATDTAER